MKFWMKFFLKFFLGCDVQRVVTLPVGGFCTLEKAQEVEDFYDANPVPEAQMELNRTLERMRTLGQWLQRDEGAMIKWLQSKKAVE